MPSPKRKQIGYTNDKGADSLEELARLMGGARIDSMTRVVKKDGSIIENLYAVGDKKGGIQLAGDMGADYVKRIISAFTWCVASGCRRGCIGVFKSLKLK